ncbi:hypothetical protein NL676_011465 [Syzygium grande]|nr:hypothetical protein NL676_011465 [Syzygium grande]
MDGALGGPKRADRVQEGNCFAHARARFASPGQPGLGRPIGQPAYHSREKEPYKEEEEEEEEKEKPTGYPKSQKRVALENAMRLHSEFTSHRVSHTHITLHNHKKHKHGSPQCHALLNPPPLSPSPISTCSSSCTLAIDHPHDNATLPPRHPSPHHGSGSNHHGAAPRRHPCLVAFADDVSPDFPPYNEPWPIHELAAARAGASPPTPPAMSPGEMTPSPSPPAPPSMSPGEMAPTSSKSPSPPPSTPPSTPPVASSPGNNSAVAQGNSLALMILSASVAFLL